MELGGGVGEMVGKQTHNKFSVEDYICDIHSIDSLHATSHNIHYV